LDTVHHIVLFRLREGVREDQKRRAIELLRSLGRSEGVTAWRVEESEDTRKGLIIAEVGSFASRGALRSFQTSAAHAEATAFMAEIADWWVADFQD
jgi:hypothetical protein